MRGQVRRLIIFIALAVFLGSALGFADTQYSWGKKVFALYKKSDNQTDKENEINWYLSKSLKDMGFEIVFYDIDRGIPALSQLTDVRVVISWFRGNAMNNPIEYILFLSTMIDLGKKVIVLDNFGAYQDAKTGEYVNVNIVNIALSRLGLLYFGDWTQETDKLEVDSEDKGFHSFNGLSKDKMLKFYYRFQVSDRNLKVVLALKRTDRDYGASPVIVYNSSGGGPVAQLVRAHA